MSFCPNCGTTLEPSDRFCPKCGHSNAVAAPNETPAVSAQAPPTSSPPPAASPKKGKGKTIGLIVGAGCLTLLLGAVALLGLILFLTGGATDAAKTHLQYLAQGDVESAYRGASPAFRESITLEAYRDLVNARPILRQTKDIAVPDRQVENNIANVNAQLTDSDGALRKVPMRLRKEGGEWLVIAIDLSGFPVQNPAPSTPPGANTATPAPPSAATAAPPPAAPTNREPSVGPMVVGSGRTESGALIRPGEPVASSTDTLSADIPLINHPLGGGVQVWIEHIATGRQTAPISATIEGEGSGNLPFDLHLNEDKLTPGKYRLVVVLGEDSRFVQEFEVK